MGPTVKAGVRTGFTVPDGSEKTGHKTRQKGKTEKANKPNNKQNPQSAKHFFPSNDFMASARSFNTLYGIAKALISKLTREAVC